MHITTLADFCEQNGLPVTMVPEVAEAFQRMDLVEKAKIEERVMRCGGRPDNQALPFRDEDGTELGCIEARIPKDVFFRFAQQENFGWAGLQSDDGMRDLLKAFPQFKVETVSGRIFSGWGGKFAGRRTVKKY